MAEIAGATVTFTDYTGAPTDARLLNVPDAVGDITVQDVLDTLSAKQAELDSLIYDALLDIPDTSGKQVLSATKQLGITCVMIRTRIKFEDLAGPTYTIKRVTNGNLAAIDNETDRNQIEEMESSAFVNWKTESDVSAALISGNFAAADSTRLAELHRLQGLESGTDLVVTPSSRTAGAITQTITGDPATSVTVTRP